MNTALAALIAVLWFLRSARASLFWLYLWQLKSYQVGRFLDYFRTAQGKHVLFNKLVGAKLALLALFLVFDHTLFLLLLAALYGAEVAKALRDRRIKMPVLTPKSIPLLGAALGLPVLLLFFTREPELLLLYDLLLPVTVSLLVSAFQPVNLILREVLVLGKARKKRAQFSDLRVVGITGSYGKTTTKEILSHILSSRFRVLKTPEHLNSEVGIARTVLSDLKEEHEVFVCEMGAYKKGEIKMFSSISQPTMGIVTGVNEQHLALFGSMENLLEGEGGRELVAALPQGGVIIANGNNTHARELKAPGLEKKLAGDNPSFDLCAEDKEGEKEGISFTARSSDGDRAEFRVNLIGLHNAENVLLAALAAKELGMSLSEIAEACTTIPSSIGAMQLKKSTQGWNVVDSTYSANPDGVLAALEYLRVWEGKKAIVLPSLIELGSASARAHRQIGEKIGEVCELAIVTTQDHVAEIREGAKRKGMEEDRVLSLADANRIMELLKEFGGKEDVILLEGGKESALQAKLLEEMGLK